MSANANHDQSRHAETRSAEDIEHDLAATREQLEGTLEALGAKLDVKTRTSDWTRETALRSQQHAKILVEERGRELSIAGGVVVVVAALLVVRRVRHR